MHSFDIYFISRFQSVYFYTKKMLFAIQTCQSWLEYVKGYEGAMDSLETWLQEKELASLDLPGLVDIFMTAYRLLSIWFFTSYPSESPSRVATSTGANLSLGKQWWWRTYIPCLHIRFNRISVSGELSWENPTVAFSAKCEPRTRCRYLKATARSKHVSVIVRSISLSRFPCHDFAIRPIGISFGVWLPLPCQEKILFTIWLEARDLYASTLLPKHIISISTPDEYCESRARD